MTARPQDTAAARHNWRLRHFRRFVALLLRRVACWGTVPAVFWLLLGVASCNDYPFQPAENPPSGIHEMWLWNGSSLQTLASATLELNGGRAIFTIETSDGAVVRATYKRRSSL